MKATYEFFAKSKSGALQKNEEFNTKKGCFLYPSSFLFEENFYLMEGKRRSHGPEIKLVSEVWSTVAIKRLICSMRDHNYSKIVNSGFVQNQTDGLNADLYFHPLKKIICLTLDISLFSRMSNKTSSSLKMSQSIHSIFLFLEDRLPNSDHVLEMDLPQTFHLETLIRLFRRQIKDVSFLHLLRIVFYKDKFFRGKTIHFHKEGQKGSIDIPFRNFYSSEIDSLFLIPWKRVCKSRVNYFPSIDCCNITRKERHVSAYEFKSDTAGTDSHFTRSSCVHYGRYKNKFILVFEGTRYFVKKWLYYFSTLLKHYLHYRAEFDEPRFKLLSTSCVSFLGYTSIVRLVSKNVHIEAAACSYISILGVNKFHSKLPNSIITKILAKHKFCDISGRPTGKAAWAGLPDDEILNGYVQLWQVFSLYYGASMNQDRLRRLKYILQVSCDSTLAGKHRSTIRLLRRKFNLETLNQFFVSSKSEPSNNRRVWRSTLIRFVLLQFAVLEIGLQ
uniref:Maturase K n=1 Tax=Myriopteris lindheimeri TaxID=531291 RepID=E2J430_MYRLI|nr:maturase K [Myriopteris lindheimeri]ADL29812.1 maturase K [Myriopteris lindheimeri]